jgi:O-antigen ligase
MYIFSCLVLFAAWMLPLHIPPWISWHNEIFAFSSIFLMAGTAIKEQYSARKRIFFVPKIAWTLAVLCIVTVVQLAVQRIEFIGDAITLNFYLLLCFLSIVIGYEAATRNNPKPDLILFPAKKLAMLLMLGAAFSVIAALVQSLDVWDSTDWVARMPNSRRPGGNLVQPNQLATLLMMGIASVCYLYEARKTGGGLALLLLFVLTSGVAVTESRTGVLSYVLLAGWLLTWRKKAELRTAPWVVVIGCSVLFALLWAWPIFIAFVQSGGMTAADVVQVNLSAGTRLVVWPQLMEAVLQKPWFGWGLLGVSEAHNAVLDHYATAEPFTYAHNIILDMAVGMGLPLTLLLVTVTAVWLWRRVRATKSLVPWYCLAVMLPFGVHSMLEFPFAYAYFLVPVMFAVGVLEATLAPQSVVRIGWWPAAVGFGVVAALMAWTVVEYIAIEEDFRVVRFEALRVGQTPGDYERPKIYLLTQLDALLEAGRIVPAPGMTAGRVELARKIAMRYPWTATQNRYALSLALNGYPQEALRQLKVMRVMHGEAAYKGIRSNWTELANTKYPQLQGLAPP